MPVMFLDLLCHYALFPSTGRKYKYTKWDLTWPIRIWISGQREALTPNASIVYGYYGDEFKSSAQ